MIISISFSPKDFMTIVVIPCLGPVLFQTNYDATLQGLHFKGIFFGFITGATPT